MRTMNASALDIDPFADEFLADPWPDLETVREAAPVVFLPRYQVWALARYAEVVRVLREARHFSSASGIGYVDVHSGNAWRTPSIVLEVDKPEHTRTRRILSRILSETVLARLAGHLERSAEELVSRVLDKGEFDAVTELAEPFPVGVLSEAVGLRAPDPAKLLGYGAMAFDGNGPPNARFQHAVADPDGIVPWIDAQCERASLLPAGFGAQLYAEVDAGRISEAEARLLVRSLFSAGIDTTVSALGFAVMLFAQNPGEWAKLRAHPSKAKNAFEEVLRIQPPFVSFFRTTTDTVPLGDVVLPDRAKVLVLLAGAARDPRRWTEPDRFDIDRDTSGQVSFGYGIHRCVGQTLARLEGACMLKALIPRVKEWELCGTPVVRMNNTVRGLERLPVRVVPE